MTSRSLKTSVTDWVSLPRLHAEFGPRASREAANRVRRLLGEMEPKPARQLDLGALHTRIRDEWRTRYSLTGSVGRDMRQLPWILFYPPRSEPTGWLGAEPRIVAEYRAWLLDGRRTRSALALLYEFLRVYPTDLPSFPNLRQLLREVVEGVDSTPPPSLERWKERCSRYWLLEDNGCGRFVSKLLSVTSPGETLADAGLDAGLSRCAFLRSGIRSVLPEYENVLTRGNMPLPHLHRLLNLLQKDGKLCFDDRVMRAEVAQALLCPFIRRSPQPDAKKELQSFFLRHFRDPRLPSGKHRWSGVPGDAKRVMIKWLVEQGLADFFALVEESAYDHHWRYREAFWKAFLEEGLIDDIWFVLGANAKAMLRNISSDPEAMATTAQLRGAKSDQSVLLMRIRGVTIAEWSHEGSCHLWREGVAGAPVLYRLRYSASEMRRSYPYERVVGAHSQRHDGSPSGRWQGAIAAWLRDNTGIRLARDRYFPDYLRGYAEGIVGDTTEWRYRKRRRDVQGEMKW